MPASHRQLATPHPNRHHAAMTPTTDNRIETIGRSGKVICMIVRGEPAPTKTEFYTPNDFTLQVGHIAYKKGHTIARHVHPRIVRTLDRLSEVLVIEEGRVEMDLYDDENALVATRELGRGDVAVLVSGGHGFRILEDAVMVEIKQGPYSGKPEKEMF
jgi:hypothetical protein